MINWDDYQIDPWDRDLTRFCYRHGQYTDTFGLCMGCLEEPRVDRCIPRHPQHESREVLAPETEEEYIRELNDELAQMDKEDWLMGDIKSWTKNPRE